MQEIRYPLRDTAIVDGYSLRDFRVFGSVVLTMFRSIRNQICTPIKAIKIGGFRQERSGPVDTLAGLSTDTLMIVGAAGDRRGRNATVTWRRFVICPLNQSQATFGDRFGGIPGG